MSNKEEFLRIVNNDFSVGSGVYSAIVPEIKMIMNDEGEYRPLFTGRETEDTYARLLNVDMMSDRTPDETKIGKELYSDIANIKYNKMIGYYLSLYAGHVVEEDFRNIGSSGGMTTWILTELLRLGKIDGVIHVQEVNPKRNGGILFKYGISRSIDEVKKGAKSRYYPMELSEVLKVVNEVPGEYAVVGIPEFITELRLLTRVNPTINGRIKYTIGLICGHQKTAKYTEALAWQHGIKPGDLIRVDYRVKQPHSTAIDYLHEFTGYIKGKKTVIRKGHGQLFVEDWGLGFFKSKFSDYTNNIFNELADVVFGDAWLPKYNADGKGNNIVIVRNEEIHNIVKQGMKRGAITLEEIEEDEIKDSQTGLVNHAYHELPYRLYMEKKSGKWIPKKRVKPSGRITKNRKAIQQLRRKIFIHSRKEYKAALNEGDWNVFERTMTKFVEKYRKIYTESVQEHEWGVARIRGLIRPRTRLKNSIKRVKSISNKIDSEIKRTKYRKVDGVILTLNGYFNYGNILQRYALQEYLHRLGYDFISYERSPTGVNREDLVKFKYTTDFVEKYIRRKTYDAQDRFPAYIVGSDQVWRNWDYSDEQKDVGYFFLDFLGNRNVKRLAYAASFGKDRIEDVMSKGQIEYIHPLIEKFDKVSVREQSAVRLIRETWGIEGVQKVVDPTLLLSREDYSKIVDACEVGLEKIEPIFSYILEKTPQIDRFIQNIKSQRGQESTDISAHDWLGNDALPPVELWLKGFRDAQLVLTNSYHGLLFSIINNKEFIVIGKEDGGIPRVREFLKEFNLENRLILEKDLDNFNFSGINSIDWNFVNKKMEKMRKSSMEWLQDSINEKGLKKSDKRT